MKDIYEDDNYTGIFNRYNTFTIYLPLLIYFVSIMYIVGFLKGFLIYYITCPIIILMMFLNISNEDNTIKNFFKIGFFNIIGIILCWGLMLLVV